MALGYPVAPMAKRRTAGIQRRTRASEAALNRRLADRRGLSTLDWRLLLIGGVLVIGAIVLLVVLLFGTGSEGIGAKQVDQGGGHVADGEVGGPYSSVPGTSGTHWNTPHEWGVFTTPLPESQVIHNLEHGGIVIWYMPARVNEATVQALTGYVNQQITTSRFKVILSPWNGADFEHAIAVTAWSWLMYLDTPDIDQIRRFLDDHYGEAPEPLGGPGQPAAP
jgi:hypothetical protein